MGSETEGDINQLSWLCYTSESKLGLGQAYDSDAGFDLPVVGKHRVPAGELATLPSGLRVKLPPGTFGWVVARSSTFLKYRLLVAPGVMDPTFRGEYKTIVFNLGRKMVEIEHGARLAQLIVLPNLAPEVACALVDRLPAELEDVGRGTNGLGSSGR